jgi:hypothetical protein
LGDLQQTKQNTFLMEPNLADKNQKEKTKPWNPEPPAHTKLLHATLNWENRRAPTLPYELQTCLGDTDKKDWCWRSNTRSTKTEILLLLNQESFFFFFFLSVCCLVHCLFVHHLFLLISLVLHFFFLFLFPLSFLVLLVLL